MSNHRHNIGGARPPSNGTLDVRQTAAIRNQIEQQVLSQLEGRRVNTAVQVLGIAAGRRDSGTPLPSDIVDSALAIVRDVLGSGAALLPGQVLFPTDDSIAIAS